MSYKSILFIRRGKTRFEDQDVVLLSNNFRVTDFSPKIGNLIRSFGLVRSHDVLFYWFPNDYKLFYTIIARIFGKKVVVIGGGQMSTADTKYGRKKAGVTYRPFFRLGGILCIRLAHELIAVSEYEKKGLSRYYSEDQIHLIYNNYNTNLFKKYSTPKDLKLVVTISAINKTYFTRKGLDLFIEAAKRNPDYKFVVIGKIMDEKVAKYIRSLQINNLILTGFVSDDILLSWLKKASIYCQFSRQEGFGVALAEAQACNCVPFVSTFGAIPEVAGPNAFYIEENPDWDLFSKKLLEIKALSDKERGRYSERVLRLFGNNTREKSLVDIINCIIK